MHPSKWSSNLDRVRTTRRVVNSASVLAMVLSMVNLPGPTYAADTPSSPPTAEKPVGPDRPATMLGTMADHLETQPDFVVLNLEGLSITQHDVAGVIRAMPTGMAALGFQKVYQLALDVMVRQKAMVLHARLEHMDKDPAVIHQQELASERALADAWLKRQVDAAVTDQAVHERYDRDAASKLNLEKVRARVIMVPTQEQAMQLLDKLAGGGDFADLARQFSKDPSASSGGDLGFVARDGIVPEIGATMFSLSPGQTTAYPVVSPLGYYIIRVEARSASESLTFDEARPALERAIRTEATQNTIGSLLANVKMGQPAKPPEQTAPAKP